MTMKAFLCLPLFGLLLVATGCATPEARIKRHAELFATFPPEVQEKVREGVIQLGYTQDMVFLAIGQPNHTQQRVDSTGTTLVWRYTAYRWSPDANYWPRRYGPWWNDPYWDDREEYDVLRVEFRDNKVTAIEYIDRLP